MRLNSEHAVDSARAILADDGIFLHRRVWHCVAWLMLAGLLLSNSRCLAGVIYVDSLLGSDKFDGKAEKPLSAATGPVQTIRRGLQLVHSADTLVLANNPTPYYESMQLAGPRHSGFGGVRFTVVGNGAVIDGSIPVPAGGWKRVGENLWKLTPWRKGHFQLLLNGKPAPEHPCPPNASDLSVLPASHWCAWRGSIYYKAANVEQEPNSLLFRLAVHGVGLSLYQVHDVQIIGVTFRHFRLDGVNAHDLCRDVLLEDVTTQGNGRAGLFAGGTSNVLARRCQVNGNRRYQILISGHGSVELQATKTSRPPTLIE